MRAWHGLSSDGIGAIGAMALASVVATALNILTGIITARLLGPEGRGELMIVILATSSIAQLSLFGLDVALGRRVGAKRLSVKEVSGLTIQITAALILCGFVSALLIDQVGATYLVSDFIAEYFVYVILISGFGYCSNIFQSALISSSNYSHYCWLRIAYASFIFFGVAFAWQFGGGIAQVLAAYAAAGATVAIQCAYSSGGGFFRRGRRAISKELVREAFGPALLQIARWADTSALAISVAVFSSVRIAGLFAVALVAANSVAIATEALSKFAFGSTASSLAVMESDTTAQFVALAKSSATVLVISSSLLAPVAWYLIPIVYGNEFAEARSLVFWLVLAVVVSGLANIFAEAAKARGASSAVVIPKTITATAIAVSGLVLEGSPSFLPQLVLVAAICHSFQVAWLFNLLRK